MKYLKRFNKKLSNLRLEKKLDPEEIAEICSVDLTVASAWESEDDSTRCYPTLENLLDLCLKTGKAFEFFIDLPNQKDNEQLELPGLAFIEDSDLNDSIKALDKELSKLIPTEDEQELLRRYRKSDSQSKELILQLIAN